MNLRNAEINKLTKESIAVAAANYIIQHDYSSLSVITLCDKAGVSRNAYYRNFGKMNEVLKYYLIIRWEQYAESIQLTEDMKDRQWSALIHFIYSEQDFIRGLRDNHLLSLIEELFISILIPTDSSGINNYLSYGIAYSIYGFIRAMIDNDFKETPEQILALSEQTKSK